MKKTLILLAGALVLLAVVLLKNRSDVQSRRADAFLFDTASKGSVEYLQVIHQKDTATLFKAGGQWVTASDSFPVDTAKIHKVLGYLLAMQGKEKVSKGDSSRRAEYGLDSAQIKHVEWRQNGKSVRIALGKTSGTDYSSTYWRWADKPEVYRTPGNFNWELGGRATEWKDRALFKADAKNLRSIEADWRDSTGKAFRYKVEVVDDSTMKMLEPEAAPVKKDKARDFLARGEFTIDDFVMPGDTNVAKVKVDSPVVALKFNLKDGKSHELKASRTLDGYSYAKHPRRADIVKIGSWRFDAFKLKPFEIAAPDTTAPAAPPAAPTPAKKTK